MDENELNEKLKNVKGYIGSFSLDELQNLRISIYPCHFVINLDLRKNSGTHWIGLSLYHNDVFICDSLGTLVPSKRFPAELVNFLHIISHKKFIHITKQLQPLTSSLCGKYTSVFIYYMSAKNDYSSYLSNFSKQLSLNDCIISLLFDEIFTDTITDK